MSDDSVILFTIQPRGDAEKFRKFYADPKNRGSHSLQAASKMVRSFQANMSRRRSADREATLLQNEVRAILNNPRRVLQTRTRKEETADLRAEVRSILHPTAAALLKARELDQLRVEARRLSNNW